MEGLQMGVMTETQTSIISPNASLPANPIHANQTPGSHGGADSRCRTDHEVENSAITPPEKKPHNQYGYISREAAFLPWRRKRVIVCTNYPHILQMPCHWIGMKLIALLGSSYM